MRQSRVARPMGAAILVVLGMAGCAGPQSSPKSSLDAAAKACERSLHTSNEHGCDNYVALAVESKNTDKIFHAYTLRAVFREFHQDLPGALADNDQALATLPGDPFARRRRAALLGESGEYAQALELFADIPSSGSPNGFEENMAMNEYVAGDRTRSVLLFQAAADDYAQNDHDENMAALLRFNAAIIESELKGGDLAPIAAQDVVARTDTMLPLLKRHRLGEMSDADLIARVEKMTGSAARENVCDAYFSVGHCNAVVGNAAAARQAFEVAAERCSLVTFEHHAAVAWLRQLGT